MPTIQSCWVLPVLSDECNFTSSQIRKQMQRYLDIQVVVQGLEHLFPKFASVLLIEAGTHLIVDALMCPYRIGERVRVKKLLRSVTQGMLLMWNRGLHSYAMIRATLDQKCDYLGRVPKNVKFQVDRVLEDGSYLSWIAPDGKSKKKGCIKIMVRVIEYTIDTEGEPEIYRLITSLINGTILVPSNPSFLPI